MSAIASPHFSLLAASMLRSRIACGRSGRCLQGLFDVGLGLVVVPLGGVQAAAHQQGLQIVAR